MKASCCIGVVLWKLRRSVVVVPQWMSCVQIYCTQTSQSTLFSWQQHLWLDLLMLSVLFKYVLHSSSHNIFQYCFLDYCCLLFSALIDSNCSFVWLWWWWVIVHFNSVVFPVNHQLTMFMTSFVLTCLAFSILNSIYLFLSCICGFFRTLFVTDFLSSLFSLALLSLHFLNIEFESSQNWLSSSCGYCCWHWDDSAALEFHEW